MAAGTGWIVDLWFVDCAKRRKSLRSVDDELDKALNLLYPPAHLTLAVECARQAEKAVKVAKDVSK